MKRFIAICLFICIQSTSSYCQTNKTIRFGNNGKIEIPSKLEMTDLGPKGDKVVILKTNTPIDGCYFYFKFSYLEIGKSFSIQEFRQEKLSMLDKIQNDFNNDKTNMEKVLGAKFLTSSQSQFIEIDKAVGTSKSYTYSSQQTGTRRAKIIQLYFKDKIYYLTFGWGLEGDVKLSKLSEEIINSIVF